MGRFYKTSSPQILDFTLKLPEEMMIQAVKFNDQMIETSYQALDKELQSLQGQGLDDTDKTRLKQIFDGYKQKIDEQTKLLGQNVLQWRNRLPEIKNIGTDIFQNKSQGEWSKIQSNYDIYTEWAKKLDEMYAKNPDKYTAEDIELQKAAVLASFKGTNYDPKTGKYNSVQTQLPEEYYDTKKIATDLVKDWKANSSKITTWKVTPDGKYIYDHTSYREGISADEVRQGLTYAIMNDPKAKSYFRQKYQNLKALGADFSSAKDYAKKVVGQYTYLKGAFNPDDEFEAYMYSQVAPQLEEPVSKTAYSKTATEDKYKGATEEYKSQLRVREAMIKKGDNPFVQSVSKTINIVDPDKFDGLSVQEQRDKLKEETTRIQNELTTVNAQYNALLSKGKENLNQQEKVQLENLAQRKYNLEQDLNVHTKLYEKSKNIVDAATNYALQQAAKELGINPDDLNKEVEDWNKIFKKENKIDFSNLMNLDRNIRNWTLNTTGRLFARTKYQKDINTYNKYYFKWFQDNADANQMEYSYVVLPQSDPVINKAIDNVIDNGVYINDASPFVGSDNSHMVAKKGWSKGTVTIKDLELKTGLSRDEFITGRRLTTIGGKSIVEMDLDLNLLREHGVKIKQDKGQKGVIAVEVNTADLRPTAQYMETYMQSYDPNSAAIIEGIKDPGIGEVFDVANKINENIVDYVSGNPIIENQVVEFGAGLGKMDIVPVKTDNGINGYQVQYYLYNNSKGDYEPVPFKDSDGNVHQTVYYSGDNASFKAAQTAVNLYRTKLNLNPVQIPDNFGSGFDISSYYRSASFSY